MTDREGLVAGEGLRTWPHPPQGHRSMHLLFLNNEPGPAAARSLPTAQSQPNPSCQALHSPRPRLSTCCYSHSFNMLLQSFIQPFVTFIQCVVSHSFNGVVTIIHSMHCYSHSFNPLLHPLNALLQSFTQQFILPSTPPRPALAPPTNKVRTADGSDREVRPPGRQLPLWGGNPRWEGCLPKGRSQGRGQRILGRSIAYVFSRGVSWPLVAGGKPGWEVDMGKSRIRSLGRGPRKTRTYH